jgi:hypothetical protein
MIPNYTDIEKWAKSLIIDFPNDNIPILSNGDKWRKWGDALVQENSFSANAAPTTKGFEDWQTWAYAVFKSMANV